MAEILEGLADFIVDAGSEHVVGEKPAHEELHGHIVDAADVLLVVDREGFHHAFDDAALDGHGGGNPPFAARRGHLVAGHGEFQLVDDFFFQRQGCNLVHDEQVKVNGSINGARKICSKRVAQVLTRG